MKKSIIAAGAASVALAAMPIVGAFAVATVDTVNDAIQAVVNPGCTVARAGISEENLPDTAQITVTAGGSAAQDSTTPVSITCSDGGWTVTVAGNGQSGHALDLLLTGDDYIAPGTSASEGSYWAWKADYTLGSGSPVEGAYAALTNAGATILSATDTASYKTGTFTPSYEVKAASNQKSGTYNGGVTYTITSISGN